MNFLHERPGSGQAVNITPEGSGRRQPVDLEKTAEHGIEPDVDKVPDPIKADKQ